jgi:hypothetical protein
MVLKMDALRGRRREEDGSERNERRAVNISISSEAEPSLPGSSEEQVPTLERDR